MYCTAPGAKEFRSRDYPVTRYTAYGIYARDGVFLEYFLGTGPLRNQITATCNDKLEIRGR